MTDNIHIASLVADVMTHRIDEISSAIEAFPYAEVAVRGKGGKLVILIDAPSMRHLVETTEDIRDIEGIYSLLPVYQHEETDSKNEDQNQTPNLGLEKRI